MAEDLAFPNTPGTVMVPVLRQVDIPGGGKGFEIVRWYPAMQENLKTNVYIGSGSTYETDPHMAANFQGAPGVTTVRTEEEVIMVPGDKGQDGAAGMSAYDIAVANGFSGTVSQWLTSLIGASGANGQSAYDIWKSQGNTGTVSDFLLSLVGPKGDKGQDGTNGTNGLNGTNGRDGVDGKNGLDGAAGTNGTNGRDGTNGLDGKAGTNGTNGTNGKSVELRIAASYLQWRQTDGTWSNLISVADITGPKGNDGVNGTNGTNGTNGLDGKSVQLQATATAIQWRLVGTATWTDLVQLSALTGSKGDKGDTGATGLPGATLLGTVTIAESALISLGIGTSRAALTFPAAWNVVVGQNLLVFANSLPAGVATHDVIVTSPTTGTVGLTKPLLTIGAGSITLRVVRINV